MLLQQGKQTVQAYLEQFTSARDVVAHCGGNVGAHPGLVNKALANLNICESQCNRS